MACARLLKKTWHSENLRSRHLILVPRTLHASAARSPLLLLCTPLVDSPTPLKRCPRLCVVAGPIPERPPPLQQAAAAATTTTTTGDAGRNRTLGKINGEHAVTATATASSLPGRGERPAGGRGGGGRGVRRRRPGEGRGRGADASVAKRKMAAFTRSRDFVLKVRGMSRWNWRGVLEELEKAEETEARLGEVRAEIIALIYTHTQQISQHHTPDSALTT